MASKDLTFVIIPGAFHRSECMSLLISHLQQQGFPARTATLRSVDNAAAGLYDDTSLIRNDLILPILERSDAVYVCHSYGGAPSCDAIKGLSKVERTKQGFQHGILGVIWMSAFLPPKGFSMKDLLGGFTNDNMSPDDNMQLLTVRNVQPIFYHDVPAPIVSASCALIGQQSVKSFAEPIVDAGYQDPGYDGRRAYVKCLDDVVFPVAHQEASINQSGAEWIIRGIKTSHSPFLSDAPGLTTILIELARLFQGPT